MPSSSLPMPPVPEGWTILSALSAKRGYTVGYWLSVLVGLLFTPIPEPPEITYVLRYEPDGTTHTPELGRTFTKINVPETLLMVSKGPRPLAGFRAEP